MSVLTAPAPTTVPGRVSDLDHYCCPCSPDRGLCGTDLTDFTFVPCVSNSPDLCMVCVDLADSPCDRCGD